MKLLETLRQHHIQANQPTCQLTEKLYRIGQGGSCGNKDMGLLLLLKGIKNELRIHINLIEISQRNIGRGKKYELYI